MAFSICLNAFSCSEEYCIELHHHGVYIVRLYVRILSIQDSGIHFDLHARDIYLGFEQIFHIEGIDNEPELMILNRIWFP